MWKQISQTHRIVMLAICLMVIVVDQITKHSIEFFFEQGELLPVIDGFFNLTLHYNRGVAFGFMSSLADGTRELVLATTTLFAMLVLFGFIIRDYLKDIWGLSAIAAILGGAIGNSIDRFGLGYVIDFFDFYYQTYHYATFNVADSAICIGVAILIFRTPKKQPAEQEGRDSIETSSLKIK